MKHDNNAIDLDAISA